jgi:hypothetical protein
VRKIVGFAAMLALMALVASARADDDDAKLRAVIDKAIKAHGGADNSRLRIEDRG